MEGGRDRFIALCEDYYGDYLGFPCDTFGDESCDEHDLPSQRHPLEVAHTERFLSEDLLRRVRVLKVPSPRSSTLAEDSSNQSLNYPNWSCWGRGLSLNQSFLQTPSSLEKKVRVAKTLHLLSKKLSSVASLFRKHESSLFVLSSGELRQQGRIQEKRDLKSSYLIIPARQRTTRAV